MSTYNSISDIKRIAFIDKLTDERAKELSQKYPFAICYATEHETDINVDTNIQWLPGFWKDGKRYGIQQVDVNPIRIGEYVLTLECVDNVLKLNGAPRIKFINPFIVKSYYSDDAENNINIQSDSIEEITDADVIKIYNNAQSVICSFDFYNNTTDTDPITQADGYPSLYVYDGGAEDAYTYTYAEYLRINRLSYESNQYQISSILNNSSVESVQNIPISFVITDNVYTTLTFQPYKFPDNIAWTHSGDDYYITTGVQDPTNRYVENLDNEIESINIDFGFNNDILPDEFGFYFSVETTETNETVEENITPRRSLRSLNGANSSISANDHISPIISGETQTTIEGVNQEFSAGGSSVNQEYDEIDNLNISDGNNGENNEIGAYLNNHYDDSSNGFITEVAYITNSGKGSIRLNTAQRNGTYKIITKLVDFDKDHNPLSVKNAATNITLHIGDWIDDNVFYIGEFNNEFNTSNNITPDTVSSSLDSFGWHHILEQQSSGSNLYYYEEHPLDTYSIANNLCIIIPADYTFCLPIFENNTLTNRIEDSVIDTLVADDYPKDITVYHKNYKLYKFNNNTLLSFINSIVKQ